jgi:hypothetical protein
MAVLLDAIKNSNLTLDLVYAPEVCERAQKLIS